MRNVTTFDENQGLTSSDKECMVKIKRVIARGNNVEVKGQADGSFKVYEVKKSVQ